MIILDVEQGSPEWHQARCGVVTASNFSKVLAKGRGKEPSKVRATYMHELANEILTGCADSEGYSNAWMERGKEVEAEARSFYTFNTGNAVQTVGFIYRDESKRVGCSPDSLVGDDGGLELKAPKLTTHLGYILDGNKTPSEYVAQVQGCIHVTNREWWDFQSFHPSAYRPGHIVREEKDEAYQARLDGALAEFIEELDALVMWLEAA